MAAGAAAAGPAAGVLSAGSLAAKAGEPAALPHVFRDGFEVETLQFSSAASATFRVGQASSFTVATSQPAALELVGDLPPGLTFEVGTGVLAGTAAPASGGVHLLQVTARIGGSPVRVQIFTLTVEEAVAFTSTAGAECLVGSACTFTLAANGYPAPSYALPNLPAGLVLESETGIVSGTPTAGGGGLYALTASATNIVGTTEQAFTLTVNEAPTITSANALTCQAGLACGFQFSTSGFPAPIFSLPALPAGLSLDDEAGTISGMPAAGSGGPYALAATATNSAGTTDQAFALTINEAPTITSANAQTCQAGFGCGFQLSASGYPAPTYSLPALPATLSVDAGTGAVSGTPTPGSGGLYALTASATNILGTTDQALTLNVTEAPTITSVDAHDCETEVACEFQFTASGYPAPTYSLPGLPSGLSLDSASGTLGGTPAPGTEGQYVLTLTADNGEAPSASQPFTLDVIVGGARITAVSPAVLVPGGSATLTGVRFDPLVANNTVTIGGVAMTVTMASATTLAATVPCIASGNLSLRVETNGGISPDFPHPLQANQYHLQVGGSAIATDSTAAGCTELAATGEASRYVVAVFSNSTSPSSNAPFQMVGSAQQPPGATAIPGRWHPPLSADLQAPSPLPADAPIAERTADIAHQRILEANAREYERLGERFADDVRMDPGTGGVRGTPVEPPLTRTFRISNLAPPAGQSICSSFYVVAATRVYYDGKIAIYEDDATPVQFKSANSAQMSSNYQRIGDQFNADMEPIVRENFGDILIRDATTDNNGALVALFTPHINNNVAGVAGFVVSCDQFPNDDTTSPAVGGPYVTTGGSNGASNFGEFFYAYQPVVDAAGYTGNTPENWYRTIRSTFIHESKHVASQAARTVNGAPGELAWLEEGTARHAEELWMRNAVDFQDWESNIPYGSAANPINIYCDMRPGVAECDANPRRPASIMQRHFTSLYTNLFGQNARLLSPFGRTPSDNASYFYAISWSLVRYAVDRYGLSDAEFLTALNQASSTGADNLAARAGVPLDELLGGWALSLVTDDYPGLTAGNPDTQIPTWNFRDIYSGLNTDFPGTYTLPYPQAPGQFQFGNFTASAITTLRGGGVLWYEISGTQLEAQMIMLQGASGASLPATVRIAVARVQ